MEKTKYWKGSHTFSLVIIIIAMLIIGLAVPTTKRFLSWILMLILLLLFCLIAGNGMTGVWRGLLIDERNKISLSRLQLASWTVVVLSGFMATAFSNISSGSSDPLAIAIPEQLWVLMGISVTSFVGSPLIMATKMKKQPNIQTIKAYANRMMISSNEEDKILHRGLILYNKNYEESKWSDLFEGECIDSAPLDLGKIQMFYFTLILLLVYAVDLGTLFLGKETSIHVFPGLSPSMVALLAISHGGYLIDKAIPRS